MKSGDATFENMRGSLEVTLALLSLAWGIARVLEAMMLGLRWHGWWDITSGEVNTRGKFKLHRHYHLPATFWSSSRVLQTSAIMAGLRAASSVRLQAPFAVNIVATYHLCLRQMTCVSGGPRGIRWR